MVQPRTPRLSIRKQYELLAVNRSWVYYKPVAEKPENVAMMNVMDRHLTQHPTEGVKSMVDLLVAMGFVVGPKRIRRLFRIMGRQTLYRRKNLTKSGLKAFIKPNLLNGLKITHANQVWCTDITYIPMKRGLMYLMAIIDVYSRKIVGWGISNPLNAQWCKNVLEEAMATHGKPEIVNSDTGSQYTSALWTQYLEEQGIRISMDVKGRALDNVWIERFWKSLKYDYVYINPADDGFELYEGVQNHIGYYNHKTHHSADQTPHDRYQESLKKAA
ncbi:MAG TPA: IS3 family transposase [Puia sp.]|nr:IS3 family transposase [Puia sp.]